MRIQRMSLWTVLLGLSVFFGAKGMENLGETRRTPSPPAAVEPGPAPSREALALGRPMGPESAYAPILRENLFSPDREPPAPAAKPEPEASPETPIPAATVSRGDLELFGVIQMSGYETALVKDAQNPSGSEGNLLWVKKGDRVGELEVKEIFPDSVVLQEGEERVRIALYDKRKPVRREEIRNTSEPTVVRTGPARPAPKPAPGPKPQETTPKAANSEKSGYVNPFAGAPGGS